MSSFVATTVVVEEQTDLNVLLVGLSEDDTGEGEHLILSLDMKGIAVSSGAACKSGSSHPSHVLLAMGVPANVAQAAVRFSLGRCTTDAEIDRVLDIVPGVVEKLRQGSPTLAS